MTGFYLEPYLGMQSSTTAALTLMISFRRKQHYKVLRTSIECRFIFMQGTVKSHFNVRLLSSAVRLEIHAGRITPLTKQRILSLHIFILAITEAHASG
jgi:hypothetical protein